MATLTIRDLPDELVERLKSVARSHGHSMEQEVRSLLEARYAPRATVIARIQDRWAELPEIQAEDLDAWLAEGRP